MKAKILAFVFATALLVGIALPATVALGDNNGQAIGQDPVRLALTQCSNAGKGNGGEYEVGLLGRSLLSDCLAKRLGSRYSRAEIEAIIDQSNCRVVLGSFICEIDPGNSADHNQAGN